MREFVIATDSDTEIPYTFAEEYGIPVFEMPYTIGGEEKLFDLGKNTDFVAFYERLADGEEAATSTRSPKDVEDFFREILDKGKDILQLSFTSALSAHYGLCVMAKEKLSEEYPDARIEVVDTKRISVGAGQLVMEAQRMKNRGADMDEIIKWVEDNCDRAHSWFSVDDLNFLKRGGRVSNVAAAVGTILGVKPILKLNHEGKIVATDKVKGTKNILKFFMDTIKENIEDAGGQEIFVLHANALKTAEKMKAMIEENIECKAVRIQDIGPVIGCHTGPGALSIIFMGKEITS